MQYDVNTEIGLSSYLFSLRVSIISVGIDEYVERRAVSRG
jgi:hypothetical protein